MIIYRFSRREALIPVVPGCPVLADESAEEEKKQQGRINLSMLVDKFKSHEAQGIDCEQSISKLAITVVTS